MSETVWGEPSKMADYTIGAHRTNLLRDYPPDQQFGYLDSVVRRGIGTFVEVGAALLEIRESRLYRFGHQTFDAYCNHIGLSKTHAYRLITASEVAQEISPIGDVHVSSESQARELAAIPEPERARVWQEAVEASGGEHPTAKTIREVAGKSPAVAAVTSSASVEWYTPRPYVDAARKVLGGIDLDPASCPEANEIVGAAKIYTEADNGLAQEWAGNVWLNPPYGTVEGESSTGRWLDKLIVEHDAERVAAAIFLCNAQTAERWFRPLWFYPLCFTHHRIRFRSPAGESSQPTHGNVFAYLGDSHGLFIKTFREFGHIVVPKLRQWDGLRHGEGQ